MTWSQEGYSVCKRIILSNKSWKVTSGRHLANFPDMEQLLLGKMAVLIGDCDEGVRTSVPPESTALRQSLRPYSSLVERIPGSGSSRSAGRRSRHRAGGTIGRRRSLPASRTCWSSWGRWPRPAEGTVWRRRGRRTGTTARRWSRSLCPLSSPAHRRQIYPTSSPRLSHAPKPRQQQRYRHYCRLSPALYISEHILSPIMVSRRNGGVS